MMRALNLSSLVQVLLRFVAALTLAVGVGMSTTDDPVPLGHAVQVFRANGSLAFEGTWCLQGPCGVWTAVTTTGDVYWRMALCGNRPCTAWSPLQAALYEDAPLMRDDQYCSFNARGCILSSFCGYTLEEWCPACATIGPDP